MLLPYFIFIILHYYCFSFPRVIVVPSYPLSHDYSHRHHHYHHSTTLSYLQQQRTVLFSSQLLSTTSSSSSFNSPREQQQEEQQNFHHQQQQPQLPNNNNNNNELPITQGVQLIIENQLQLLTAATKSITAELYLFFDDQEDTQSSYKLTKFLSHSPPSTSPSTSDNGEGIIDGNELSSEEILENLLSTATEADTMIRMNGKSLAIPIYNNEFTYGYLFLQRGKNQKKGPRTLNWEKDTIAINYAQNTAVSLSHILSMESDGFQDVLPSSLSSASSIQSAVTTYEMNKILLSFYPRLQEAKVGLKFIRTFSKNLQKRILDNDEMGKEMAENIFVQVEALEETIDGMEASLASIPEEIEESSLYSEQGQPLLPLPNDQEFYEDEVDGDFDGNKVVAYQMMKLDH
eukprot:gene5948-6395_t